MLVQKKRNTKKLTFMVVFLVIIIAGAVWYFAFGARSKKGPASNSNTSLINENLPPIGSLNTEIFKDSRFSDLEQHGTLPVEPGQTGKDNPFTGVTTK